ncbi:MAG: hypothetical protein AAGB93_02295 [Planctomycetota bacterium]
MSAREVPAYSRISRDDLFDGKRGNFATVDVRKELADENGIFLSASEIVGRVLARVKSPGYVFTENDFLPKGTRPGLAGGIPPGKRAFRIEVDLVHGIIGLNPGDRFDLLAASTTGEEGAASTDGPTFVGLYSNMMRQRSTSNGKRPRAQVDVIVNDGVVVTPLETRVIPVSSASLTSGLTTSTRPVQEMVIALRPDEVSPLLAAIKLGSDITCIARSGRPGEPENDITPGFREPESADDVAGDEQEMHVIEVIHGRERALVPVPRRSVPDETSEDEVDVESGGALATEEASDG